MNRTSSMLPPRLPLPFWRASPPAALLALLSALLLGGTVVGCTERSAPEGSASDRAGQRTGEVPPAASSHDDSRPPGSPPDSAPGALAGPTDPAGSPPGGGGAPPQDGRWLPLRPTTPADATAELTPEQRRAIEQLNAVGYVAGSSPAPKQSGVTFHAADATWQGWNFFTSGHAPEAVLMDMDGHVLHRWIHAYRDAWPDAAEDDTNANTTFWRRAHLFPNGDILAIHDGLGLLKLDKDSNLLWARANRAHHDLFVMDDGDIWVLTREAHMIPRITRETPLLEDYVSRLDAQGNETWRMSLLEAFERSPIEHSWWTAWNEFWEKEKVRRLAGQKADLFHANSIVVLEGRFADRAPAFAAGNLLLSFAHLDMVAVVDPREQKVVWSRAGVFGLQHDPRLTADGHVLVFDNHWRAFTSRVVELDLEGKVLWQYAGTPERPFYSRHCGTAQRLPNGNTLVTESDNGRAFELTPQEEIAWEFYNPHRAGEAGEYIATLFELERLPADFDVSWSRSPAE